jgi:tRNA-Thr(GGU) m(6)t(6)A37 methyltransferase TsaA
MTIAYEAIGIIHSPFTAAEGMPIQPAGAAAATGTVEVFDRFVPALQDLDGFSHICLLYHFHRVTQVRLVVTPFLDHLPHGVFATRAPTRPNPIGLSVVRLTRVDGNVLHIEDLDIMDGTPLLDIKPYAPEFDHYPVERIGWLAAAQGQVKGRRSDDRFR